MIEIKDIITLSDHNDYVVISKALINNSVYYFLADIKREENIKFCLEDKKEDKMELIEIEDAEVIQKILPYLAKNVATEFKRFVETIEQESQK